MNLWLNGIDPAILMEMGVAAELREAQPWLTVFEVEAEEEEAVVESETESEQESTEEGDPADVPFMSAVFLPVLLAGLGSQGIRRRRAAG
jgi:hypothetical protein